MSTKQIKEDVSLTFKGLKKAYKVTVGVLEALAWGGLLATAFVVVYRNLKGEIAINDALFFAVVFSAIAITFRLLIEGARYFREVGKTES